jgi:hypothetical protein
MRDIETIDGELRLVLAIRRTVPRGGRPPNTAELQLADAAGQTATL